MQVARAEIEYVSEEVQRESLEQAEPRTSTTNQAAAQRDQLGEAMAKFNRSVNFKVDQDTGVDVMTVRDRSTGEVVRQYPPKEFLTLVSRLEEMRGVFFEEVA
jgi:flagellar protein FlaG